MKNEMPPLIGGQSAPPLSSREATSHKKMFEVYKQGIRMFISKVIPKNRQQLIDRLLKGLFSENERLIQLNEIEFTGIGNENKGLNADNYQLRNKVALLESIIKKESEYLEDLFAKVSTKNQLDSKLRDFDEIKTSSYAEL